MANTTIMNMPVATAIDGSEYLPIVQAGTNKRVATGLMIAGSAASSEQAANLVLAGPATGSPAAPTFRALVAADFGGAVWTVPQGGTGLSTLTPYALLAAGTTATGNAQQVSGLGNLGQVLSSNGAGALPTWETIPGASSAALTRVDDTNVTLTLGGTPATALLQAVSITAGWTGTLAAARGGTGVGSLGTISKTDDTNVTLTLGGTPANSTIQNVSFTLGWTGTLAAARGGTGVGSLGTLSRVDDTNVTLTLGGTPTNSLIQNVSITAGWTGQLGLTRGGTAASLTASDGGIVYSTSSALAILSGTATAGQIIRSGSSTTPSWSTSTYPATSAAGTVNASLTANTITATVSPVLGAVGGGTGTLALSGNTSGVITIQPQAAAGTYNFNLPTTVGTAGQVLTSQGGGSTAMTWETVAGTGTVTSVGGSFTGGLVSVGGSPVTTSGTLAFTVAGTSGGIPYFSSTSAWASSAALAANALVIGGGAGAAPATTTTGTGVLTALGVNVGSAGAFVTFNGALGTPSSGTLTNCKYPNATGALILDSDASHTLGITTSSNLTADRLLTFVPGDAARTVTISANATISQDYSTTGNPQFATIELGAASDTTLSRASAGRMAVEGKNAILVGQTDTLTAGYGLTSFSAGTKSSGTFTPAYSDGNMQYITNGGAFTLAPQSGDGTLCIKVTNNGSAGTITTSGFTKVIGTAPTTTNANAWFAITIVNNGNSTLTWQALQ